MHLLLHLLQITHYSLFGHSLPPSFADNSTVAVVTTIVKLEQQLNFQSNLVSTLLQFDCLHQMNVTAKHCLLSYPLGTVMNYVNDCAVIHH